MTIETTRETTAQLAIRVRVSFLAVRTSIDIVIRLSEPPLVLMSSDNRRSTVFIFSVLCFTFVRQNIYNLYFRFECYVV